MRWPPLLFLSFWKSKAYSEAFPHKRSAEDFKPKKSFARKFKAWGIRVP